MHFFTFDKVSVFSYVSKTRRAFPDSLSIPALTLSFSSHLFLPQHNKRVEFDAVEINISIWYCDMSRKGSAVESHLAGVEIGRVFSNKFTDLGLFTRPSFQIFACLALLVLHYMLHMWHVVTHMRKNNMHPHFSPAEKNSEAEVYYYGN